MYKYVEKSVKTGCLQHQIVIMFVWQSVQPIYKKQVKEKESETQKTSTNVGFL
jgi:hypothetical protein